jgi:hypothetical protein
MFMSFSCGTKDSDYSISDSPEPELRKAVSISLHRYNTLCLHNSLIYPKIRIHVNLTSPHPDVEAQKHILKCSTFLAKICSCC